MDSLIAATLALVSSPKGVTKCDHIVDTKRHSQCLSEDVQVPNRSVRKLFSMLKSVCLSATFS